MRPQDSGRKGGISNKGLPHNAAPFVWPANKKSILQRERDSWRASYIKEIWQRAFREHGENGRTWEHEREKERE